MTAPTLKPLALTEGFLVAVPGQLTGCSGKREGDVRVDSELLDQVRPNEWRIEEFSCRSLCLILVSEKGRCM